MARYRRLTLLVTVAALWVVALSTGAWAQKLTFWHSYTQPSRIEAIDRIVDAFEAAHPGVTIEVEIVPFASFYQRWTSAWTAGTLPDVSTAVLTQAVLMAEAGVTQPVDDLVESMGGRGVFLPKPIETLTYKGATIGLPHYSHARLLWYRKDLFEAAGVKVPETWEELKAAAVALNQPPARYGMSIPLAKGGPARIYLWHLIIGAGGRMLGPNGEVSIDSQPVRDAVEFMLDLYRTVSPQGSITYGTNDNKNAFFTGRSAMIIESPFIIGEAAEQAAWFSPERLAGVPVPTNGGPQPWMNDTLVLVLMKDSKNAELAKEFLRFMFEEEQYVPFLHSMPGGQLPTLRAVAEGEAFYEHPLVRDFASSLQHALEGVANGTPVGMESGTNPWAGVIDGEDVLAELLQFVATGMKTVDQAIADAQKRIEQIVQGQ